ncbi:MAG: DUF3750 domain-containing protein [Gammaproteobacteria bacterium]
MKWLLLFILILFIGPILLVLTGKVSLRGDYRTADRESSHIAPDPATTPEAIVQIYAARAFKWRGMFSVHMWIAVKPAHAEQYQTYQVIGWRVLRGLSAVLVAQDIPDRYWFDSRPWVVLELRGDAATAAMPQIDEAARDYPYQHEYHLWPGPNSNTFVAYIVRRVPELQVALPSNALGKDFLPQGIAFVKTPSGTGYQITIYGLLGLMLAKQEGLEINILGMVFGINPFIPALELPGIGRLSR